MKRIFVAVLVVSMFATACSKKKGCTDPLSLKYNSDAEEDDGSCTYAGSGGNSSIAAFVVHHVKHIYGSTGYPDSAYVKFNAKESPGLNPASYDMAIAGDSGEDHVHINGLKTGYYWVQAAGFDSAAGRVTGGRAFTISTNGQMIEDTVYVTE